MKYFNLIVFGILIVFLCPLVMAGIASGYYSENPLIMAPGETRDIEFGRLQNLNEGRDIILEAELLQGSEIATLTDPNLKYPVPLGEKNVAINMKVFISNETIDGEEYLISVKLSDITPSEEEGMIVFAKTFTWSIPVLVQEPSRKLEINIWWILLVILIIILIIVFIFYLRYFRLNQRREKNYVK